MSEYQYYEFRALDRPLTEKEVRELRSYSTRAVITPTSFVNHYEWGNFKGDEDVWMEKYFDAFVYVANWGTHILKLRFPSEVVDIATARQYCVSDAAMARQVKGSVIITMTSEDEEGYWEGDEEWLPSLIPLRTEIAHGDLRALYLGWLLCAQMRELPDEPEPDVPPNLSKLSVPLSLLAKFLRIDESLIAVAAQASPSRPAPLRQGKDIATWVAAIPQHEKNQIIVGLLECRVAETVNRVGGRFERQHLQHVNAEEGQRPRRRTVGELLDAAERYAEEQRRAAAIREAKEKERLEQERAIDRGKYLDSLVGRETKLWAEVDRLVATTKPKHYDEALTILVNLRDLASRKNEESGFKQRIQALRHANTRKPSFLDRLAKADV